MAGSPPACKELVGVTGSVVKTRTKSMIALALQSSKKPVYQSHGNWNNRIGVALSLMEMEMEMSGRVELLELARMAEPNIRGGSHFDNFSLEQFAVANGERFWRRQSPEMRVFLNADDLPLPCGVQKGGIFDSGLHLALNACAAAAVATRLGVSLSQVGIFLSAFSPLKMRSELEFARNDVKIVNDAYNANSVSTRAAIDSLQSINCKGKKISLLGDMLELGAIELESHKMILERCRSAHDIDLIGLVGKRFCTAAKDVDLVEECNIVCALEA